MTIVSIEDPLPAVPDADVLAAGRARRAALAAFQPERATAWTNAWDALPTPVAVGHYDSRCALIEAEDPQVSFLAYEPGRGVPCPYCVLGDRRRGAGVTDVSLAVAPKRGEIEQPSEIEDEILARCAGWLAALRRPVEIADVSERPRKAAIVWLGRHPEGARFLASCQERRVTLKVQQIVAILNTWRDEIQRKGV